MVNANSVNARIACANRAHFCVFLLVLGRFLLFKNPVKYSGIFEINQKGAWANGLLDLRGKYA